jgi:hypothetical protein
LFSKKDLERNNDYLNDLVDESRQGDLTTFDSYKKAIAKAIRQQDYDQQYQQIEIESEGITLVTKAVFPLTCSNCSHFWHYCPRNRATYRKIVSGKKIFALCPSCRNQTRIKQDHSGHV